MVLEELETRNIDFPPLQNPAIYMGYKSSAQGQG